MTPKEKAENLILKYLRIPNDTEEWFHKGMAKQCALITADELIKYSDEWDDSEYWKQVKQEIEKL